MLKRFARRLFSTTTYYTKDHEWFRVDSSNGAVGLLGITDYAQQQLGDIVFVDLPSVGKKVGVHKAAATVESVKVAAEVYAPISGTIVEANEAVRAEPQVLNKSAINSWIVKIEMDQPSQLSKLMSEEAYTEYLKSI